MIEEATLILKTPTKICLAVMDTERANPPQSLSHDVLQVTSPTLNQTWYIDGTGAQFNIPTTCATAEEYMARYGDQMRNVTPAGTLGNVYEKLSAVPGLGGMRYSQDREGVRAVKSGIDL